MWAISIGAQTTILNDTPDGTFNTDSTAVWVHAAWFKTTNFAEGQATYTENGISYYTIAALPLLPDNWALPTGTQWNGCIGRYYGQMNEVLTGGKVGINLTNTGYYNTSNQKLYNTGGRFLLMDENGTYKAGHISTMTAHTAYPDYAYTVRLVWTGDGIPPGKAQQKKSSFLPIMPGYEAPTVTVEGVTMATIDYVDALHPDGWFPYPDLASLVIPEGWFFPEPGDYFAPSMQIGKCTNDVGIKNSNGLNWGLDGKNMRGTIIQPGRFGYYWCKARNDFYSMKLFSLSSRYATFEIDNSISKGNKCKIRLVKNHVPKMQQSVPAGFADENLKIYLGLIPEPTPAIDPLPVLASGLNVGIVLPAAYNNMRTYKVVELFQQNPATVILEIWDAGNVSQYWRYNAQFSACWSDYLKSGVEYKILVQ